jgi:predicted metal-dependent hydrolase
MAISTVLPVLQPAAARVCYYAGFPASHSNAPKEFHRMNADEVELKFRRGLEQFNHGEFFEAHETWEEIWLTSAEPEKTFLQGIIQVSAAFHHYSRSNHKGACSLMEAGLKKLDKFPASHRDCEIGPLRDSVRLWIEALSSGRDPGRTKIPRIARGAQGIVDEGD